MGEISDWLLDQGEFDSEDDDEEEEEYCSPLKCKRCGSTDVRWRQQGGRWVLFSLQPGVEHRCPNGPSGEIAPATDFD